MAQQIPTNASGDWLGRALSALITFNRMAHSAVTCFVVLPALAVGGLYWFKSANFNEQTVAAQAQANQRAAADMRVLQASLADRPLPNKQQALLVGRTPEAKKDIEQCLQRAVSITDPLAGVVRADFDRCLQQQITAREGATPEYVRGIYNATTNALLIYGGAVGLLIGAVQFMSGRRYRAEIKPSQP